MAEYTSALAERSTIVVSHALAAQQWELHLAARPIDDDATPGNATLFVLGLAEEPGRAQDVAVALTANQEFARRRVVAESDESRELIGHAGAADWAQRACS